MPGFPKHQHADAVQALTPTLVRLWQGCTFASTVPSVPVSCATSANSRGAVLASSGVSGMRTRAIARVYQSLLGCGG